MQVGRNNTSHIAGCLAAEGGFMTSQITSIVEEDICGFCGEPGADKIPHPVRWPGEYSADTELVHAECEQEECRRAHACLDDGQRRNVLREISKYG